MYGDDKVRGQYISKFVRESLPLNVARCASTQAATASSVILDCATSDERMICLILLYGSGLGTASTYLYSLIQASSDRMV